MPEMSKLFFFLIWLWLQNCPAPNNDKMYNQNAPDDTVFDIIDFCTSSDSHHWRQEFFSVNEWLQKILKNSVTA